MFGFSFLYLFDVTPLVLVFGRLCGGINYLILI